MAKKFNPKEIRQWLLNSSEKIHKRSFGQILVLAGSRKYPGAAGLVCEAASRCGAGYICWSPDAGATLPSFDIIPLPLHKIKSLGQFDVIVLGPGLTSKKRFEQFFTRAQKEFDGFLIVDASALKWFAETKIRNYPFKVLITPHEGELATLIGRSSQWISRNREVAVLMAQKKFSCVVVLKGPGTLVADTKSVHLISQGNAALAKAGTGDILSGMIGAFALRTKDLQKAALIAASLHGSIADDWLRAGKDILSLTPSDILQRLPRTLASLRARKKL
jgi:NAD(P)H-hydrate repair Nnr-like enzyme with NAD(P)H-hydrate dehydratase domain